MLSQDIVTSIKNVHEEIRWTVYSDFVGGWGDQKEWIYQSPQCLGIT